MANESIDKRKEWNFSLEQFNNVMDNGMLHVFGVETVSLIADTVHKALSSVPINSVPAEFAQLAPVIMGAAWNYFDAAGAMVARNRNQKLI